MLHGCNGSMSVVHTHYPGRLTVGPGAHSEWWTRFARPSYTSCTEAYKADLYRRRDKRRRSSVTSTGQIPRHYAQNKLPRPGIQWVRPAKLALSVCSVQVIVYAEQSSTTTRVESRLKSAWLCNMKYRNSLNPAAQAPHFNQFQMVPCERMTFCVAGVAGAVRDR